MAFASPAFVLFLALTLVAYGRAGPRWRPRILLTCTLVYYASWGAADFTLMCGLVLATHLTARSLGKQGQAGRDGRLVGLAVVGIAGLMAAFKFSGTVSGGWSIAAPLGLSYVSFKLIGYLLDVHWERADAERRVGPLLTAALFFPQVVSGPIHRVTDFLGQVRDTGTGRAAVAPGARLVMLGLSKKLMAEVFAPAVAAVHQHPLDFTWAELLLGAYCFAFQLYLDFSGLTDLANGIGHMFGIDGPENFNRPFFARSIQEFWQRWHVSLSAWLADYLFTPLRMGLRQWGAVGLAGAIMANMMAIGLWHGARWTYLTFGVLNGFYMVVSSFTLKRRNRFFRRHPGLSRLRAVGSRLVTFHLVVLAFVVFRAESLGSAMEFLGGLFGGGLSAAESLVRLDQLGLTPWRLAAGLASLALIEAINQRLRTPQRSRSGDLMATRLRISWPGPAWAGRCIEAVAWGVLGYLFLCRENAGQQFFYAQF